MNEPVRRRIVRWLPGRGGAQCLRDRSGAAAVEFALVSMFFISSLLLVAFFALVLFLQQQLDFAATKSARQVMNGTVQKNAYNAVAFRANVVCSALPSVFDCNNVIINLQTATRAVNPGGYYPFVKTDLSGLVIPDLASNMPQYSVGVQGSYEYLQLIYPITFLPGFITTLFGSQTYNGMPAYLAVSTAAFRNEQY